MILKHNREVTQAINDKLSMIRDEKRLNNMSQRFVTAPEVKIVPSYIKAYEDGLSEGTTKRSFRSRKSINTSSILERFKKKNDNFEKIPSSIIDKELTFYWRKIENFGRMQRQTLIHSPSRRIKILQPNNRHSATMVKLDSFYMFGGKSHEVHDDLLKLDFQSWAHLTTKTASKHSLELYKWEKIDTSDKEARFNSFPSPMIGHDNSSIARFGH